MRATGNAEDSQSESALCVLTGLADDVSFQKAGMKELKKGAKQWKRSDVPLAGIISHIHFPQYARHQIILHVVIRVESFKRF